jgi:hypothetical protein
MAETAPDQKNGINLIPSRYHWDQLDAKLIVVDINFPVRCSAKGKILPLKPKISGTER